MHPAPSLPPGQQRGAASLLVVVVLFFILALVTAYAGRNLIFEQRTSINNQRAVQALEVAESGLEYAISRFGTGRVDARCVPTDDVAHGTFRDRYLASNADGVYDVSGTKATLRPTCMLLSTGPDCSCPTSAAPALIVPVGGAPAFQLRFETTGITQAGVVRAVSKGCSSIGQQCYTGVANDADAVAEVSVLLGLNSALASPPSAALVVRGTLDANNGSLGVVNTDAKARGITINAGGPVLNTDHLRLVGMPGTPGASSVRESDPSLSGLTTDRMFVSLFGMDRQTYRSQPAAIRVTCTGDCSTAIAQAASSNPGRVIWLQGPVSIDSNIVLGSAGMPVMLVVQGDLTVAANVTLYGMLYLHDPSTDPNHTIGWTTTAGATTIHGAVVSERNLAVLGGPTVVFDPAVLRTINLTQGSLVRVPGSWRDFAAGS